MITDGKDKGPSFIVKAPGATILQQCLDRALQYLDLSAADYGGHRLRRNIS